MSTITFSALPQLLDAGVLETAIVGATSSNRDVSALCREILHALSFNAPIAARMGRNPKIREELVSGVRERMDAAIDATLRLRTEYAEIIRVTDALAESRSPSQGFRDAVNERSLMDPSRDPHISQLKTDLHEVGGLPFIQRLLGLSIWLGLLTPEQGRGNTDHGFDGGNRAEGNSAPGMEIARGIRTASRALVCLRNVLGASRSSFETHAVDDTASRSLERRWPMTWLYGDRGNVHDFGSEGSDGDGAAEWPVDQALVHSIARLMDAISNTLHLVRHGFKDEVGVVSHSSQYQLTMYPDLGFVSLVDVRSPLLILGRGHREGIRVTGIDVGPLTRGESVRSALPIGGELSGVAKVSGDRDVLLVVSGGAVVADVIFVCRKRGH